MSNDHCEKIRKARCWLGIERDRHPAGKLYNMLFGLCQVADGFIRILSLGYLHSRLPSTAARNAAEKLISRRKAALTKEKDND
jgi:hypothetical protein